MSALDLSKASMNHIRHFMILCDICEDEVYREFFGEPNSSPHEVRGAEQPPVSAAASPSAGVFE